MSCTQKQQLVCFPKVRVYKPWFRHFNDHKDFRNEGTVHLFSLMALFSYANFRSNERVINGDRYMEAPGQWICKIGALPRILRVHSKTQALELMEYFQNHGFLTFEILDEEKEILRFTIADWKEHCTHLQYNYYSYKGSGFFFFPLPVGRLLLKTARKEVGIVFSELDAIMDMWLHTILNDPKVRGSEYMPVVYYFSPDGQFLATSRYSLDHGKTLESVMVFWAFIKMRDNVLDFCASDPPAILSFSSAAKDYDLIPGSKQNIPAINAARTVVAEATVRLIVVDDLSTLDEVEPRLVNDYGILVGPNGVEQIYKM